MTKTLFMGNLSWNTSEQDLERVVSPHAEVISARVATDRDTGRSRGFGFVEVPENLAEAVIGSLNGTTLDGREITVNEARPRAERSASSGRRY